MDARPLRDLLSDLVGDGEARLAYGADPAGYLAAHGHPDLPAPLVSEAVVSYADTAPVEVAEVLAPYVTEHGPVPVDEPEVAQADWFDLLTSADRTDDPFGEHHAAADPHHDWTDPAGLDFGAGAAPDTDPGDQPPTDITDHDAAIPDHDPSAPDWTTSDTHFAEEPPIDGLDDPDDPDDPDDDEDDDDENDHLD
jgi:hypothetical protein